HHRSLERAQPIVHEKKWHEDRRNAHRHEPFIADVTWRMKELTFRRELVIKLLDQRHERCPLKLQPKCGNAVLEKPFVTQRCPIGRLHLAQSIDPFRLRKVMMEHSR